MSDLRHTYEGKIPAAVIDAANRLFRARPWRDDEPGRLLDRYQRCANRIAEALGFDAPNVMIDPYQQGLGYYDPETRSIVLEKYSVTTLWHLLRVHMWFTEAVTDPEIPVPQLDAAGWSLSLFHQTRPEYLQTAIDRGRICYIQPALVGAPEPDESSADAFPFGDPRLN